MKQWPCEKKKKGLLSIAPKKKTRIIRFRRLGSPPLCLAVQRERQKEKPDPITFRFIAMLVMQRHRLSTGSQEAQKVLPCVASIVLQFFSFLLFPPQHIKVKFTKNILRTFPAGFHAVKR